jgi:hypothetical protein
MLFVINILKLYIYLLMNILIKFNFYIESTNLIIIITEYY